MLNIKANETAKMSENTGNHISWCAGQVAKSTTIDEARGIADEANSRMMKTAIFCIENGANKFGKPVNVAQKRIDLNFSIESAILAEIRKS